MVTIDINCDLGEGFENDEVLFNYISSANIACGFHAGNASVMHKTVSIAIEKGVAIGAHPGFQDLANFGRSETFLSEEEIYDIVLYQIGSLYSFVKACGGMLHHVKPHGALYNMAARDSSMASAIVNAIYDFDKNLILYALSGSEMITSAIQKGLQTASEVFSDRTYQDDGSLTPRSNVNAMITNESACVNQVLQMVKNRNVKSITGNLISLSADTICIHGDGDHAVEFAKTLSSKLNAEGVGITAPKNRI